MRVIKENVFQSIAQGSLVSRARKRSNRSELQIVKTQEKFGTKHQRPCALCMYSFSEINLVQAVPFKVNWGKMRAIYFRSQTNVFLSIFQGDVAVNEIGLRKPSIVLVGYVYSAIATCVTITGLYFRIEAPRYRIPSNLRQLWIFELRGGRLSRRQAKAHRRLDELCFLRLSATTRSRLVVGPATLGIASLESAPNAYFAD